MNQKQSYVAGGCLAAFMVGAVVGYAWINAPTANRANAAQPAKIDPAAPMPMFGGSLSRNMVNLIDKNVPVTWNVEEGKRKNIKWVSEVGSKAYGGPVIADGKVFVGTNNENPRDPKIGRDKGKKAVLMAFAEADGKFLWQIVHDFPDNPAYEQARGEGLCSTPVVEGKRLYYLAPGTVVCADTAGKVQWTYDLEKELGVVPHHIGNCSPLVVGDLVMVITGNGVDEEGKVVNPKAPSFIALNKNTGKLKWQSSLPGDNIIEGQWTNPSLAVVNGKPQVIFPGGDCVLYSFEPETGELIWKCNLNPERKKGKKVDNYIIATPVVVGDRLYLGIGCYPEHPLPARPYGYMLCVDVTKKGDVSPKSYNVKDAANKDSALVWAFGGMIDPPPKGRGREVYFGHTISTACVHGGLIFAAENLGYIHCLDAKTGQRHWFYDTKSSFWGSPYYVDGNVYINADDGDVYIFKCDKKRQFYANGKLHAAPGEKDKVEGAATMEEATLHSTPVVANGVLYIATRTKVYAIAKWEVMSMSLQTLDLWSLVRGRPQIDPQDLADAVVTQAAEDDLDYRTRLLIRDSVDALRTFWGNQRADNWLASCPFNERIHAICASEYEEVGFPSIRKRLMDKTDPQTVEQYFRELSRKVRKPMKLYVGGSITLIATGRLVRHTDDVDIVDEVPKEFRDDHVFLEDLEKRYGLTLGHFQQHYLPSGWLNRLQFHDTYGDLQVYFVDPIDIFLGKLTSIRTKDRDDLHVLSPQLDKDTVVQRLKDTMKSAFASAELLERAKNNWYILFGEDLPT